MVEIYRRLEKDSEINEICKVCFKMRGLSGFGLV